LIPAKKIKLFCPQYQSRIKAVSIRPFCFFFLLLPYFVGMDTIIQYLSLESLAAYLGLPENYLRRMAKAGIIPSLNVSGRLRFDLAAVKEALIDYQRKEGGKRL
jgi:excisionase family DNA binding protein